MGGPHNRSGCYGEEKNFLPIGEPNHDSSVFQLVIIPAATIRCTKKTKLQRCLAQTPFRVDYCNKINGNKQKTRPGSTTHSSRKLYFVIPELANRIYQPGYLLDGPVFESRQGKKKFSSLHQKHPDRLWGPYSLIFMACRNLSRV
jgi:hypothetical protein